jgi:hypothetical protein
MEGPSTQGEKAGILPRLAEFIKKEIERVWVNQNKRIEIEISALEIYCNEVRDLFKPEQPQSKRVFKMGTTKKSVSGKDEPLTWIKI